jgi:hypothetical protein
MYSYGGSMSYYTVSGDNNTCNNNIFLNASSKYFSGVSNQISNNIFVTTPSLGTSFIESGNYYPVAQDAIFINQTGNTFSYEHDYHLQSPTTYSGTDNTEAGLYGGTHGYKEGAVPSNPHIQIQNIATTTDADGILNVQIKAAAQDQ